MQRLVAFSVGAVGLGALLLAAFLWFIPRIEEDLTDRAERDLVATGVSDVEVVFDGRNGVASGTEAALAANRLDGNLRGARSVVAEETSVAGASTTSTTPTTTIPQTAASSTTVSSTVPVPQPTEPMTVRLIRDGRVVVLEGAVANEDDRDLIVREIISSGYEVDDRLTVDETVKPSLTIAATAPLVRPLLTGSDDGEVTIDGDRVLITATAGDPVAAEEIEAGAEVARANGADIELDLSVVELSEDEQVVALQDELDQIFELARRIQVESPNFGVNRGDLNQPARNILDRVAVSMRRYPLPTATIFGHTDARGPADSNQLLSVERAETVRDYLVSTGIDDRRLSTLGRGEFEPAASNATADGRQENRRVNFVVTKRVS